VNTIYDVIRALRIEFHIIYFSIFLNNPLILSLGNFRANKRIMIKIRNPIPANGNIPYLLRKVNRS